MIINMATDLFSRDWAGVDVRARTSHSESQVEHWVLSQGQRPVHYSVLKIITRFRIKHYE